MASPQYVVGKAYNPTEVFAVYEGEGPNGIKTCTVALRVYDWTGRGQEYSAIRATKAQELAEKIATYLNAAL